MQETSVGKRAWNALLESNEQALLLCKSSQSGGQSSLFFDALICDNLSIHRKRNSTQSESIDVCKSRNAVKRYEYEAKIKGEA